ncbi:hypothetical protein [Hyalangium versicolor]|uniref:hypothetical protein n=1 Tax=Hyalangium versicolor TaxID=2861190 RepID=UPI001CCD84A6|nr:hypothetical protein [Hyalangium versicolor]
MPRTLRSRLRWSTLLLTGTLLTAAGCSREPEPPPPAPTSESTREQAADEGDTVEIRSLPPIKPEEASQTSLQQLEKTTKLGENVAVHVKLPPPANKELEGSLVRIVGDTSSPTVLFSSDALAKLGAIPSSPGSGFFTSFGQLSSREIERRIENERLLASGEFGEITEDSIVFNGRTPIGITQGIGFDRDTFTKFQPQPLSTCPATPASTTQGWGQSLFITSPAVVLDPARTWDPCTGAGTQGGAWTFAHLIREMATSSGSTPETFVLRWLEMWLNPYVVNGDVVPARPNIFSGVIQPWATASGVTAAVLTDSSGKKFVQLSGPLNLNIAPFRLLSIVNRLDVGNTVSGSSGYGGTTTSRPVDAGELRFIFGVVQPNPWGGGSQATCGLKPFTVIFEYGVPVTGCSNVVQYARKWTELNTLGGFTPTYLTKLQAITESVVLHGAAPGKGNQSALNQLRTNERSIASPWELREFTLSDEDPVSGISTPSNGLLRKHTVAQTPDDGAYPSGHPAISNYVLSVVKPSVPLPVGPLPSNCSTAHTVPYSFLGVPFRGGNSLVPPNFWPAAGASGANPADVCARHEFSVNTCSGCHFGDTQTAFTHVTTTGIPVTLSRFLTGGGPGLAFGVNDTQFTTPKWLFADLERRWQRLYEVAFCTQCTTVVRADPNLLNQIGEIAQVVPIDPVGPIEGPKFPVGAIRDLSLVQKILDVRPNFAKGTSEEPVNFIRRTETLVH